MIGDQGLAAVDDRQLGRRPAHVEGQHVAAGILGAEPGRRQRARRRPGFEQLHRHALGLLDMGQAAVGDHQQQRRGDVAAGELRGDRVEIAARQRLDVGVGDRRGGAFVLADLRRHVRRGADREFGKPPRDDRRRGALVCGVRVGVEEGDRDRGHALAHQPVHHRLQRRFVERDAHRAARIHPLRHLGAQMARHQRLGLLDMHVVEFVFPLAADLQRVAEAGGGHQSGDGALALDHRVGEQRRRVDDPADLGGGHAILRQDPVDAVDHAARRIVMRGQHLPAEPAPLGVVVDDDVGEGPADVDPEREAAMRWFGHGCGSWSGGVGRDDGAEHCSNGTGRWRTPPPLRVARRYPVGGGAGCGHTAADPVNDASTR